jgi:predicted RNase H-like nuclease
MVVITGMRTVMIGDTTQGYIVAPVTDEIRRRLKVRADLTGVALDGVTLRQASADPHPS